MNLEKCKKVLHQFMDRNRELVDAGENKMCPNFVGEAGIGKTSMVMQVAKERGCQCISLVLSQLEETGDILGMPYKIYKLLDPKGVEVEVPENMVSILMQGGYKLIPGAEPTTSSAKPMWVPEDRGQECILFLDDFTRCTQTFLQAIMQLLQFGSYGTWKLPKYCTIVLSSNPEGDQYNVADMDPALKTRMFNFEADFDIKIWSAWADSKGKKSELINFALWKPEIFKDKNKTVNARSYSMFMDAIYHYKLDMNDLADVIMIARGVFGETQNVTDDLRKFLSMHLDKLPTSESIINGDWAKTKKELEAVLYDGDRYRHDIAFLIVTRLNNYLDDYFNNSTDKGKGEKIEKIIELLATAEKPLILANSLTDIVKKVVSKFASKCSKNFLKNKTIVKLLA